MPISGPFLMRYTVPYGMRARETFRVLEYVGPNNRAERSFSSAAGCQFTFEPQESIMGVSCNGRKVAVITNPATDIDNISAAEMAVKTSQGKGGQGHWQFSEDLEALLMDYDVLSAMGRHSERIAEMLAPFLRKFIGGMSVAAAEAIRDEEQADTNGKHLPEKPKEIKHPLKPLK